MAASQRRQSPKGRCGHIQTRHEACRQAAAGCYAGAAVNAGSPEVDRIRDVMTDVTRAMARNVAEQLYRPSPLSDWLSRNTPPQKPRSKAKIAAQMAKNRIADRLCEVASWLKGYDVTGGDY